MIQVSTFNSQKLKTAYVDCFSVARNRINPFRGTVCGLYWKQITAL